MGGPTLRRAWGSLCCPLLAPLPTSSQLKGRCLTRQVPSSLPQLLAPYLLLATPSRLLRTSGRKGSRMIMSASMIST